jgi:hypothetical protein
MRGLRDQSPLLRIVWWRLMDERTVGGWHDCNHLDQLSRAPDGRA